MSRWIKAITLIIENNRFDEFSSGTLPFSYDKIICILDNKDKFDGYVLSDLMSMTVDTLEAMATTKTTEDKTTEDKTDKADKTEDKTTEDKTEDKEETTTLTYNGKEYTVNKAAFEKWLAENAIVK